MIAATVPVAELSAVRPSEKNRHGGGRYVRDEAPGIVLRVAAHPKGGDLMPGTGGARKIRIARPGQGKRGSYRVITFYGGEDIPVFLLSIFAKNEKIDMSQAEKNELKKILKVLPQNYRTRRK